MFGRRKRVAFAEKQFHMLGGKMHMVRRHLDGHRRLFLCLNDVADYIPTMTARTVSRAIMRSSRWESPRILTGDNRPSKCR